MSNEKRHIFLVGPSGVGKTTVGKAVAGISQLTFIDLDDKIEEKIGISIQEYFNKFGESEFRAREREAIQALSQESKPKVIATGGGSILDSRNIIDMRNNGFVVYLSAFEPDLVDRIRADDVNYRPLLAGDLQEKVHEMFIARRECYEIAADVTIATSRRDIQTVADAVIRQTNRLSGQTADASSSVVVGDDLLANIAAYVSGYPTVVLISQGSIPEIYKTQVTQSFQKAGVKIVSAIIPEGEDAKTFSAYENVISTMAQEKVTRSSCVVALGGGVIGDLSGFVASTYHRGIDVIQVPTTLLAQVDSSIGGKCGINLDSGKNLVGSFHQPKTIIADTSTLNTLSDSDFSSGLGEVVKYALLGNTFVAKEITRKSKQILSRDSDILVPIIRSCMNHKLHVVARDPYERNGIRATLNLGHTLAHAIETQTGYSIAHGAAVAIGLRFATELSFTLGRIPESQKEYFIGLIDSLKLQSELPAKCGDVKMLVDHMYADKKSDGGLSMVLLDIGGGAELVHDVDRNIVESTLTRVFIN